MPPRYEFVVRGQIEMAAVPALADFTRTSRGCFVVLRGDVESDRDLGEALDQFASLGLGLHALRQIPDDEDEPA